MNIASRNGVRMAAGALAAWLFATASHAQTQCPGDPPLPPDEGLCRVVAGAGDALLLQGDLLLEEGERGNGQVLIDADGLIVCVACDCSNATGAATATRLECPDAVISPGLIDALHRLTFSRSAPFVPPDPAERYAHRQGWRLGLDGGTQITAVSGANADQMRWAEIRSMMAGVTSVVAAGNDGQPGFVRNLNRLDDAEDLGQTRVTVRSFPMSDSNQNPRTGDCDYPSLPSVNETEQLMQSFAEGIDDRARNEFVCASGQAPGSVEALDRSGLEGGVGLNSGDLALLRDAGGGLVWQPRHHVSVYGMTMPVTTALALNVPVGLGSFWTRTGSLHLGRELACARELDQSVYNGAIGDRRLWSMATRGSASVAGMGDVLGVFEEGAMGDVVIVPRRGLEAHEAVITADAGDVALVLRGGLPLYGDAGLLLDLDPDAANCDAIEVCTTDKRVCISRETEGAHTLASLSAAVDGTVLPLFVCAPPVDERTCVPARTAPFAYTGIPTALDSDGDGVPDAIDNCPFVFNPPRPVDGDVQLDSNGNGVGDACDACPLGPADPSCVTQLFADGFESEL